MGSSRAVAKGAGRPRLRGTATAPSGCDGLVKEGEAKVCYGGSGRAALSLTHLGACSPLPAICQFGSLSAVVDYLFFFAKLCFGRCRSACLCCGQWSLWAAGFPWRE